MRIIKVRILNILIPCMTGELSFKKNLCKYFGMNASRQANARAENKIRVESHYFTLFMKLHGQNLPI